MRRCDFAGRILIVVVRSSAVRVWSAASSWLRPLTHVGVSPNAMRSEERELVTANVVILFSILVTIPDAINFLSFSHVATRYAGMAASLAITGYVVAFMLVYIGHRFAGILLFVNAVFANLAALSIILGTRCGVQYYFVAVAIGSVFVWPSRHRRMRLPQAVLGLVLFLVVMRIAGNDPFWGPPLPQAVIDSVFNRTTIGAYAISFALAFFSLAATERAEEALDIEHRQSESLLLNILPRAIATRLKLSGDAIAERFEDVTILFADVVGFTPMSGRLRPDVVVAFLNQLFSEFDRLAEKHGLEKIKTIGDAYMVAGGIPEVRTDHARAIANMALEMQGVVRALRTPTGDPLMLRIGINTGPAIAGVIGLRKFSYDLWGDTVNTASRMESHGIPGTIQVTDRTRCLLENEFEFEDRGVVEIKGKGPMTLSLLVRRKDANGAV